MPHLPGFQNITVSHARTRPGTVLIVTFPKTTPSGNSVICFEITDEGRTFLEVALQKGLLPRTFKRALEDVQRDYGGLSMISLVERVHESYPEYVDESATFEW